MKKTLGFASIANRGFQMTFATGITISVQFGHGNYCHARNDGEFGNERMKDFHQCEDAEVALWDSNNGNEWITAQAFQEVFGEDIGDDVCGWQSPDRVANLIQWASRVTTKCKCCGGHKKTSQDCCDSCGSK
jgi:hypothetical protein